LNLGELPTLDTLVELFKQMANDPDVQAALFKAGLVPSGLGPEETEKKVYKDFEMAREVFGKLGMIEK
jgi:tripartite-type tricarboxylate transporter receptor subunit TctC